MDAGQLLTWKDGLLIGIIIGQLLNARGRIDQGKRLGRVERLIAKLVGVESEDKK